MAESKLAVLSMNFAVKVLRLCDGIKGHYSLVNQLERSATSIGANIHEAQYAQGTKDFISKFEIALKEVYETEYWLELLYETGYMKEVTYKPIQNSCGAIRRMIISSIKTIKEKQ